MSPGVPDTILATQKGFLLVKKKSPTVVPCNPDRLFTFPKFLNMNLHSLCDLRSNHLIGKNYSCTQEKTLCVQKHLTVPQMFFFNGNKGGCQQRKTSWEIFNLNTSLLRHTSLLSIIQRKELIAKPERLR